MKWRPAALLLLAPLAAGAAGKSVVGSKHDLSVSGPGPIKAVRETQVCVFCHVPHKARSTAGGSNRPDSPALHKPYASSTMESPPPGAPDGATRVCLSCHDGTTALGQTIASGRIVMRGLGTDEKLPADHPSNVGTDLRRSHPVSFVPARRPRLRLPDAGDAVHLDRAGRLQCTSCHDPHREDADPVTRKFLVKSNGASAICTSCHVLPLWQGNPSGHQVSNAVFGVAQGATTGYRTVSENGCMACHASHGTGPGNRLVKRDARGNEEQTCLGCHNGQVVPGDVSRDVAKTWSHAAPANAPSSHDAAEGPDNGVQRLPETRSSTPRHVTCVDCHNPHAAYRKAATAPGASGALSGVWGIDRNGLRVEPVVYEYQVCFKCHGDSMNQPQANGPRPPESTRRAYNEVNLRRAFDPSGPSAHPVVAPGRNPDVPSLLPPYTAAGQIYCSDCHGSDEASTGTVPRGPHGSIHPHLLERAYATIDRTPESPAAYALCYKCHDRAVLLSTRSSFGLHALHVVGQATPCAACHESHGISPVAGNAVNNAHLVDFDVSIVAPSARGLRQYVSSGPRAGSCSLSCHGKDHDGLSYGPAGNVPLGPANRLRSTLRQMVLPPPAGR